MKRDKSGTLKPLEILHKEKKQTKTRRPRRLTMDLSTRKRMEEELRESEERYRILFEQFADPVALVDPETMGILECNDKTLELLGYSRKELSLMKITDLDVVESGEEVFRHAKNIVNRGTDTFETKKKCKNGVIRDIEVTARAVSLHGKNVILVVWRDITEHKRTKDFLRQSEERFRMLVEKSTVGTGISCGSQVIFANTALLRMFGYDNLEEFTGIPLLNHVAPASYKQIIKRMERIAQGKPVPDEFEYDILRKDGLVRTLRASSSHFTLQDKTYSQTTFQDITESRLAQEALKQSETKYRELIENLNDVIFSVDTSGKILYISPSVTHITGYTPEEITGRNLFDFFSQEERNRYGEQMQRTVNIGSSIGEFTITVKDQSIKWIRASSICVKENGNVAGIRGVMSDITGRKQAEQALAESEKKYRTLVETVGDAIVLTDLNGRHLFTNSAYHTSLGYTADEDPCPDGFSIVHPDDLPFVKSSMAELLKRGTMTGEYRARHKDGRWIHRYSISTLIKNKSGEPEAILTVIRDITDRKRAEAIVRQSETRYRELFGNISSGVAIYTVIDDGKDFVFVDFNKAGERIDGDRREDLIGKSIFEARPGI